MAIRCAPDSRIPIEKLRVEGWLEFLGLSSVGMFPIYMIQTRNSWWTKTLFSRSEGGKDCVRLLQQGKGGPEILSGKS